jgi:cytochrome c553
MNRPALVLAIFFITAACRRGMVDQQHLKPLAEENFFADGRGSRVPPAHTVARGELREDEEFYTGKIGNDLVATLPMRVTREMLGRGRERFDIYCAVCHGRTGEANGMIVQRGFPQPPSLHEQRLRDAPVGHFFDVITNGYGVMYPYASRVSPEDRWAIVAYIRALQLSEHATPADVDPERATQLEVTAK